MIRIETKNDSFEIEGDPENYSIDIEYIPNFTRIIANNVSRVLKDEIKELYIPTRMIESIAID